MRKLALILIAFVFACSEEKPIEPKAPERKPAAQRTVEKRDADKLDINTASEEQLSELPGIGKERARSIIRGRPWAAKDELVDRGVLPPATYDKIKEEIIARQRK
ncbi:MAG: ComEA family DNA-binding protein [Burkholderiales bacterium]